MSEIRIGISGWRYVPWRVDFYPEGLTQKNEVKFASRAVNSIEIRHQSFCSPDFINDLVFLSLRGGKKPYASGYTGPALTRWGELQGALF